MTDCKEESFDDVLPDPPAGMEPCGLLTLLVLAGDGRSELLPRRWAPLVQVVERPDIPLLDRVSTTIGSRLFVKDLDGWRRRYPPGTVEREALLLHEREHARRQQPVGVDAWLMRYLDDPTFRWAEEQRGWYRELTHLQLHGRQVFPQLTALLLCDRRSLLEPMVAYTEALAWVRAVLAGEWSPGDPPAVVERS